MKRLWLVSLLGIRAWAQDAPPLFTTSTNSVRVEASVTSGQRPAVGLQRDDFLLLDNGEPRAISAIASEELPLDIVLVCQVPLRGFPARVRVNPRRDGTESLPNTSEVIAAPAAFALNQATTPQRLMNAAANAVLGSRPGDRVAMVTYGRDPHIALPFTGDRKAIAAAIKRFGDPENADDNLVVTSEALAIEYAVRMLADVERDDPNSRTNRRRLIVLISSVFGVGTHYADEPVIRRLWDQNIILSVIDDAAPTASTTSVQRSSGGESQTILFRRYNPIHIAQATGGDRIVALDPQHPGDPFTQVRQRYTLWFNQPAGVAAGESRTIQVELSGEARRRFPDAVSVKAREGYLTPNEILGGYLNASKLVYYN